MASYTDNPVTFRPYVQQLPVSEMVSVGMEKQRRYDEGYQRIQSQIDKIAGLSIMRDVDKQYFQSKMNQLGANLRMVSMGDLSNYQLVNSIGGMVGKIGKDKNIQNAVMSTARVREEQNKMEAAQKAGKSSVNREYDFNRSIEEYLADPNIGSRFNGRYKEHIDVNKKVLDVIKSLTPNITEEDLAYARNPDGSVNYTRVADAMSRLSKKEVTEGQIKTAVNAILTADDYDELASQGRFIYKSHSPKQLTETIISSHNNSKAEYTRKMNEAIAEKSTSDLEKQAELNTIINYYKSLIGDDTTPGKLDESLSKMLSSVSTNPDGVRADLYTRNWLDQIANGFSYSQVKSQIVSSPMAQMQLERDKFAFDKIKEAHLQQYRKESLNLERLKLEEAKTPKDQPVNWGRVGDKTTQNLDSASAFLDSIEAKKGENISLRTQIASLLSDKSMKTKLNSDGALILINKFKNGTYSPPNSIILEKFNTYVKNERDVELQTDLYNSSKEEAFRKASGGKSYDEVVKSELGKYNPLTINVAGQQISFSPEEIYNYVSKEVYPTTGQNVGITISDKLTNKEKLLKSLVEGRYSTRPNVPYDKTINNYLNELSSVKDKYKDVEDKATSILIEDLSQYTGYFAKEYAQKTFEKEIDKKNFADALASVASSDKSIEVADKNYDPDKAIKLLEKPETISVFPQRQGDSYKIIIQSKSDPSERQEVPVTADFVESYLGPEYVSRGTSLALNMLQRNGRTNPYNNYERAYYTSELGRTLPNGKRTVTLPVRADMEQIDNHYILKLRLRTQSGDLTWESYDPIDPISTETEYFQSLTDDVILTLFKQKYSNIEKLLYGSK